MGITMRSFLDSIRGFLCLSLVGEFRLLRFRSGTTEEEDETSSSREVEDEVDGLIIFPFGFFSLLIFFSKPLVFN